MRIRALFLVAAGLLSAALLVAQAPAFEVASIKRNTSVQRNSRISAQPGGRVVATNATLFSLIRNAYLLPGSQIVPGASAGDLGWLDKDRFDIEAKAEGSAPMEQLPLMLQTLLAQRFKLAVHRESREQPIYALVMARSDGRLGPRLRPSNVDCAALMAAAGPGGAPPAPTEPGGVPPCSNRVNTGQLIGRTMTLERLAGALFLDRVVVDRTGLSGGFDIDLDWTPDQPPPALGGAAPNAPPPPRADGPSIFTAVQEQLGLKLEATRSPVEVLVIDHAEQPTPD